jgi:phosphoglycerol transferase
LDTHHPNGYYSPYCIQHGAAEFADIVACTSSEVADFIHFARSKGYLQDTNIVVMGDHPAMGNPVEQELKKNPGRNIFNRFISNDPIVKNTDEILPFDMFPTLVEFAGIHVEGGRLGLGYSAFGAPNGKQPNALRVEAALGNLEFSAVYRKLWSSAESTNLARAQ